MRLRRAIPQDAEEISRLVDLGVREGQLLPRSLASIHASIDNWIVACDRGRIIGCGSLLDMSPLLSEVRSLAVAPAHRENGVGAKIVEALVRLARGRGIPTVFALTRAVPFFEKQGFAVTTRERFPEKVWGDCQICPVRNACDEVAVVKSTGTRKRALVERVKAQRLEHTQVKSASLAVRV